MKPYFSRDGITLYHGNCRDSSQGRAGVSKYPLRSELSCRGCGGIWKRDGNSTIAECPFCGKKKDARDRSEYTKRYAKSGERKQKLEAWNGGGGKEMEKGKMSKCFYREISNGIRAVDDLEVLCRPCNALHFLEMKFGKLPFEISWTGGENVAS